MRKRQRKRKILLWGLILLVAAMAAGEAGQAQILRRRERLPERFGVEDDNEKLELLKKLNENWELPDEYILETFEVDGIRMEWIKPKDAEVKKVILQLHGGAYTRSLKENGTNYRRTAVQYARISGGGVLTVDYRVAPENPFPAALEDAVMAYNWLLAQGYKGEDVIIAGDSAGGGLTLATVLYLRDNELPLPAALITMSAWTNLNYRFRKPAYVGKNRADHPYISPVYGEYHNFPPMLMQVGGDELILNDTLGVAEKARAKDVSVQLTIYDGMFHVFQLLFPELPQANAAWEEVEAFIKEFW